MWKLFHKTFFWFFCHQWIRDSLAFWIHQNKQLIWVWNPFLNHFFISFRGNLFPLCFDFVEKNFSFSTSNTLLIFEQRMVLEMKNNFIIFTIFTLILFNFFLIMWTSNHVICSPPHKIHFIWQSLVLLL